MRASTARIGGAGRLVIPAELRRLLRLKEGDEVTLIYEDDELRLLTPERALARAQEMVARYTGTSGSLADELLGERRAEVARE